MPCEAADKGNGLVAAGLYQRLRFVPVLQHIVGNAAAPNGVHGKPIGVAEHVPVEGEVAHVAHHAFVPVTGEVLREHLELVHHAALKVVADGEARAGDEVLRVLEDSDELAHPRIEQLGLLHGVVLGEGLERFGVPDAVGDLAVLVHAGRSVAVELAEAAGKVVLVQEHVDAREGQRVGIPAGEQHQFLQALVEAEHIAVLGCGKVVLDHLAQDAMRGFGNVAKLLPALVVVQAGNER